MEHTRKETLTKVFGNLHRGVMNRMLENVWDVSGVVAGYVEAC